MSAWSNRNLAAMLKEGKTSSDVPFVMKCKSKDPEEPKRPFVSVEPKKTEAPAPAVVEAKEQAVIVPVATPAADETDTVVGPVSMPEALAKLASAATFQFTGTVAAPKPVTVAPPTPVAESAAAPVVTSSSELHDISQRVDPHQLHQRWVPPQPAYNTGMNFYASSYEGPRPYGGELGSVPRVYTAERQYNAQPYHPTYQAPYCRGSYSSSSAPYSSGYSDMPQSYYYGQGSPYAGGRLQPRPPYYPPRDPVQQQQQQQPYSAAPYS